jgi:hypothetical protein
MKRPASLGAALPNDRKRKHSDIDADQGDPARVGADADTAAGEGDSDSDDKDKTAATPSAKKKTPATASPLTKLLQMLTAAIAPMCWRHAKAVVKQARARWQKYR